MKQRHALYWGLVLAAATVLSIFTIDGLVASALIHASPAIRSLANGFVGAMEILFAFPLSKFASGAFVLAVAIVLFFFPRRRHTARVLLFVSLSQLTTRLIAGVLKNVFERPRPFEAFVGGQWHDRFFVDGASSFPSGHAAHFWGFFFALAIAFPRYRIPLLILPMLVSLARVLVNDHYVSDVLASAAIAASVTWGYSTFLVPSAARIKTASTAYSVSAT